MKLPHHHVRIQSPVHRLPAGLKLFLALALVLAVVLWPRTEFGGLIAIAVGLILIAAASRLPALFLLKRLLLLEPLVIGVTVLALFQPGGASVFIVVLFKTHLCLLTTILLSNTTPFSDLLGVLKRICIPSLMISTLALMHRYLFVLGDEAERMRRARASRTFTQKRRFEWRTLSTVAGQLFIRASERAERIYDSMCARGWK